MKKRSEKTGTKFEPSGVEVVQMVPSGPAHQSGLSPGDIILALNGQPVPNMDVLYRLVNREKPGSTGMVSAKATYFVGTTGGK